MLAHDTDAEVAVLFLTGVFYPSQVKLVKYNLYFGTGSSCCLESTQQH